VVGLILVPIGIALSIQYGSEKIEFYYLFVGGVPFLLGSWLVKATGKRA
jgi:hypothetical protein